MFKDKYGREVRQGDRIVYAVKNSTHAALHHAFVSCVEDNRICIHRSLPHGGSPINHDVFYEKAPLWLHYPTFIIVGRDD